MAILTTPSATPFPAYGRAIEEVEEITQILDPETEALIGLEISFIEAEGAEEDRTFTVFGDDFSVELVDDQPVYSGTITDAEWAVGDEIWTIEELDVDLGRALSLVEAGRFVFLLKVMFRGDDTLNGSDERDVLDGFNGNDVLNGEGGDDLLLGGRGDDQLNGGAENDALRGGAGDDELNGGDGDDMLHYSSGDDAYNGGEGTDTISFLTFFRRVKLDLAEDEAQAVRSNSVTLDSVENIIGGRFGDRLRGDDGENVLAGRKGFDKLHGRDGDDTLLGGFGADRLYGDGGDDTLVGGQGFDLLVGGDGADTFVFGYRFDDGDRTARDRIRDFSSEDEDMIDLSRVDANLATEDDDAFSYIADAAFSETAGELRYADGRLQGDVDGDGLAEFSIRLGNEAELTEADFLL